MIAAVANHLWHCTAFAMAAACLALLLRSYRAKVRFWIWFAASAKFIVPFSLLLSFGAHTASAPVRPVMPSGDPGLPAAIRIAQPFHVEAMTSGQDCLTIVIAMTWAAGALVIAVKRWRDWRMIRSALRSSTAAPLKAEVPVRYCPGLLEPSIAGWRKPVLLVPAGIDGVLSSAQLRAIVAHEVSHARRRDNLLASFHMIVELLFWFHPLVWWIGAQLIAERERACDEDVLRRGIDPCVYAEGILAVCRHYVQTPAAAASGVTGWSLKRRIEDIMTKRTFRELGLFRTAGLIATGAAILAAPFITGVIHAPFLLAQPAPRFDSVSVRPCGDVAKRGAEYSVSPRVLSTGCMPLADEQGLGLIQRAYVRFGSGGGSGWPAIVPVKGRPAWFDSQLYEVVGRAATDTPQQMMEGPMLRAALEDRFRLKIREESPVVPVYALTAESGGAKLTAFADGSCTAPPAMLPPPQLPAGQRYCMIRAGVRPPAIDAEGVTLGEFSKLLSVVLDRPVTDRTGLAGRYAIRLEFMPDASTPRFLPGGELARFATAPAAGTPTIARALGELGLRLEPASGAAKQLVIDHVEQPGELR